MSTPSPSGAASAADLATHCEPCAAAGRQDQQWLQAARYARWLAWASLAWVVIMPVLGIVKRRLGRRLQSGATAAEGTQNLMCAAQAAAILVGLAVVAIWPGGWPADPFIALGIAAWSGWEGGRSWRGTGCCSVTPSGTTATMTPAGLS
jgi:divalent metal cation (Fe/Co/Zn/Cd) transporter